MKTTSTLALSVLFLSSLVAAVPTNKHSHHAHLHKKRDLVVVTEEVVETVYSTTTVWVDGTPSVAAAEASSVGGLFYEHPQSSEAATSAPYTPPYVAPSPSSVYVAPSSVYTPPAYTPPASSSVYTPPPAPSSVYTPPPAASSVYVAPTSAYVAPSSAAYAAPSSSAAAAPSGGSTSPPSGATVRTGDITYYDPDGGYGACGWTISNDDHSVAIAHDTWDSEGTMSNGNPWCGQKINILNKVTNQVYEATVADKCMGTADLPCTGGNIDLTEGFFNEAFPSVNGRGHSDVFEWWTV